MNINFPISIGSAILNVVASSSVIRDGWRKRGLIRDAKQFGVERFQGKGLKAGPGMGALETPQTPRAIQEPNITKKYYRPSNATKKAPRESAQGKPCVDCGTTTKCQFAGHKVPLVQEYYRSGKIDQRNMTFIDAVQPQCSACSAKQGRMLRGYSMEMRRAFGLD